MKPILLFLSFLYPLIGMAQVDCLGSTIETSQQASNIKKLMNEITEEYIKGINYINEQPINENNFTSNDIIKYSITYKNMLTESVSDMNNTLNILRTEFETMNDAKRLIMLDGIEKKLIENKKALIKYNTEIELAIKTKKGQLNKKRKNYGK